MADTLPSPSEKTAVAASSHLNRLWTLTIASLALNALILFLLVAGAIIHHHHKQHGFAGRDGRGGGCFAGHRHFGGGHPFHHFGGSGWGPRDGFDKHGGSGFRGGRDGGPKFGDNGRGERGPGGDFGRGPGGPPPGMPGMGGVPAMMGGTMAKPDPAKMTDMMLSHLSEKLTLTDDEKAKIKPIVEQQVMQMQKDMEVQRAAMLKSMEDTKAKIKPLLSSDQQKQLDAIPLPGQKPHAPDEAKQPGQ